jgi:hypothetical protein
LEDVVWLGLAHQLTGEIGTDVWVGILEPLSEIVEGQITVPEEVRSTLLVSEELAGGRVQHVGLPAQVGCGAQRIIVGWSRQYRECPCLQAPGFGVLGRGGGWSGTAAFARRVRTISGSPVSTLATQNQSRPKTN